jgi:hypothetical protein
LNLLGGAAGSTVVLVFVGVDGQAKTVALVRDAGCYPVGMQKMTKACLDGMSV